MKLSKLANLVIVRNHLSTILGNTSIIPKAEYKSMDLFCKSLDKAFLDGLQKLDLSELDDLVDFDCNFVGSTAVVEIQKSTPPEEGKPIIKYGEDVQLELSFDGVPDDNEEDKIVRALQKVKDQFSAKAEEKTEASTGTLEKLKETTDEAEGEAGIKKESNTKNPKEDTASEINKRLAEEKKKVSKRKGVVKRKDD